MTEDSVTVDMLEAGFASAQEYLAAQAERYDAPIAAEHYRSGKAREIGDGKLGLLAAYHAHLLAMSQIDPVRAELVEALEDADKAFVPVGGTSTHMLCRIPVALVQKVAATLRTANADSRHE